MAITNLCLGSETVLEIEAHFSSQIWNTNFICTLKQHYKDKMNLFTIYKHNFYHQNLKEIVQESDKTKIFTHNKRDIT